MDATNLFEVILDAGVDSKIRVTWNDGQDPCAQDLTIAFVNRGSNPNEIGSYGFIEKIRYENCSIAPYVESIEILEQVL